MIDSPSLRRQESPLKPTDHSSSTPGEPRPNSGRDWVRWQKAEQLLHDWLTEEPRRQLDKWLAYALREDRRLGKKDRRWYADKIFAGVRYAALTDDLLSTAIDQRLRGHHQTLPSAALYLRVAAHVCGDSDCSAPLTDTEQMLWPTILAAYGEMQAKAARQRDHESLAAALLLAGIPSSLAQELSNRITTSGWSPEQVERFLQLQNSRPPLWLRLNHPEAATEVLAELNGQNFQVHRHNKMPTAIAAEGFRGIYELAAYKQGHVEIQDLASQYIGRAAAAKSGEFVWDACAGGGGKTMQLASDMQAKGVVYASDIRAYKLDEVKRRAQRAALFNIRTTPWDGVTLPKFGREVERHGGFDCVLVDAPCSSSGTWRRNPDARQRVSTDEILELQRLQLQILAKASQAVRPGGRLVYGTCSWLVAENEEVVRQFQLAHLDFDLLEQKLCGAPQEDSDTTFVAVLKRHDTPANA